MTKYNHGLGGFLKCVRCGIPETAPDLDFDELGYCKACRSSEQKMRISWAAREKNLRKILNQFKEKSKNQTITVKVISTDSKGLIVRPEGCEMDFQIKKSAIAINSADARPNRWTGGEKLDCAIADLDFKKRKVILSIKLLEEIEKKEALEKYGSEGSGKNLPFSSLSEDLKKKEEDKE